MDKVFEKLKEILEKYEEKLVVVQDRSDSYYLNTPPTEKNKKGEFFGAAQIKKNYVAFHLMPIYCFPQLLENISGGLRKKMQGKSCFNFKNGDEKLFEELQKLTESSFEKYRQEGKLE